MCQRKWCFRTEKRHFDSKIHFENCMSRTALDRWMEETKDLGAIPERELIKRGLVADRLSEYEKQREAAPGKEKRR